MVSGIMLRMFLGVYMSWETHDKWRVTKEQYEVARKGLEPEEEDFNTISSAHF